MVADFGPIKEGPFRKESQELFQFVKQNTNPEDVFIFAKPRALALLTERSASVFHETKTDQELWDYFAKISADYLIHPQRVQASHFLDGFVARNQSELAIVYSNADFVVYRIISR